MVQQNEPDTISQTPIKKEKESLLAKFEIPIDHLDYKYIETCYNGKELEQILQILQSGQEGCFPQLQKCAEDKLREVNPRSKYLRVAVPILTRKDVTNEEWCTLTSDIQSWVDDINKNDTDLLSNKGMKTQSNKVPIRSVIKSVKKSTVKATRIKSMDYDSWNKLDVDTEILKMDLEDEKLKNNSKAQDTKKELKTVLLDADMMTEVELSHAAVQAKTNGNECFRIGDYEDALQYYTNSINFKPLTATYNNRAIANIKLNNYQDAVSDCNKVLKLEPINEKALFRKAQALKLLKQFTQARKVLDKLIQINPNNIEAQNMIQNLRQVPECNKNNLKSVRMAIEDTKQTDLLEKKQEDSKVLVPIPSTSKSIGPFYKEIPKETTRKLKTITSNSVVKISKSDSQINKTELATTYKTNPVYKSDNDDDKEKKIECLKLNPIKSEPELKNKDVQNEKVKISKLDSQISKTELATTNKTNPVNKSNNDDNKEKKIEYPKLNPIKSEPELKEKDLKNQKVKISKLDSQINKTELATKYKTNPVNKSNNDDKENKTQYPKLKPELKVVQNQKVKISKLDSQISKTELAPKYKTNPVNNSNNDDKENKIQYSKSEPESKNKATELHNQDLDLPSETLKLSTGIPEDNLNNSEAMFPDNMKNFTPFEFVKYWNTLKLDQSLNYHEKLLRLINPMDLPNVLGNKLDGDMLCTMLKCMATRFMNSEDIDFVGTALTQLAMVSRIDIVLMFMNKEEKVYIANIFEFLKLNNYNLSRNVYETFNVV